MTARSHLSKHPNARPSTLAYLLKRDAVTEQLRKEIAHADEPQPRMTRMEAERWKSGWLSRVMHMLAGRG